MDRSSLLRYSLLGWGALSLVSCSAANLDSALAPTESGAAATRSVDQPLDQATIPSAPEAEITAQATPPAEAKASPDRPVAQLIKTADLEVVVEDTQTSIDRVRQLIGQTQGDLLQLQDNRGLLDTVPQSAYLQFRVPQSRLDATIETLSELGQVKNRTIRAEDVSNQLVDYEARLRNLRRAEEAVLKILDRSGDVGEILQVAQELSRIREQIEQITAQLQQLKTQVAYSTVNLYLSESVADIPPLERSWGQELKQAWKSSTRSFLGFTQGLLVIMVWLLVYSPYGLVLVGGSFFGYKFLQHLFRKK